MQIGLNGIPVGTFDGDATAPLDGVVKGSNKLEVELLDVGEENTEYDILIQTKRGKEWVTISNVSPKKVGKYEFRFGAT